MTLARTVCWRPADVAAILTPVVESASDPAFLATHQELPLVPEHGTLLGRPTVTEGETLEAFLAMERDPPIMAVVGPSGSGKTHLVRWLHAQLDGDDRYLVLYVPRQRTSLRSVLYAVLDRLPGEESRRLLEKVRLATDSLTVEHAVANVVDLVLNRLEFDPPTLDGDDAVLAGELLRTIDGGSPLPTLLRHPEVRGHLLARGGVIDRTVRAVLHDAGAGVESPPAFDGSDLVPSLRQGPTGMDPSVRMLYDVLRTPRGVERRRVAAALLDECLRQAVGALMGLGEGTSLSEVLVEARQLLHHQQRELVLLIEDFALFDRIGAPLVDALLVPATDPGAAPRSLMRTAFAMTEDPYERLPETMRTRVGLRVQTGRPLGRSSMEMEAAVDFVGSYLNAARLGQAELRRRWDAAAPAERRAGTWVPNACDDCIHEPYCRSGEAFGRSRRDHGLYPLDRAAIGHAVTASLGNGQFAPRTLLAEVLEPLLTGEAAAIADEAFPSPAFAVRLATLPSSSVLIPPAAEVLDALQRRNDVHAERRLRLLRFWLADPVTAPVNLHPTIHEAFCLPALDETATAAPPPPGPSDDPSPPVSSAPRDEGDRRLDERLATVDRWLSDPESTLGAIAVDLRKRLHELVLGAVHLNDELWSEDLPALGEKEGDVFGPSSFAIERGGGRTPRATAVRFPISADAPGDAVLLKAVLRQQHHGRFVTSDDYVTVMDRVEGWAAEVRTAAVAAQGPDGVFPVDSALHALLVTAWVHPATDETALRDPVAAVHAALARLDAEPLPAGPARAPTGWAGLEEASASALRAQVRDGLVAWVQAAQGTGQPQAIDLARLVPAATTLLGGAEPTAAPKVAAPPLRELGRTLTRLRGAVDDEARRILDLVGRHPADVVGQKDELVAGLLNAVDDAVRTGVFEPAEQKEEFERLCRDMEARDLAPLLAVGAHEHALRSGSLVEKVRAIRATRGAATAAADLGRFLDRATRVVAASRDAAAAQAERVFTEATPPAAAETIRATAGAVVALLDQIEGRSS